MKKIFSILIFTVTIVFDICAQWSTYTPLTPEEILAPAIMQRQRHDSMAKNINEAVRYINNLKSQTNESQFLAVMDGYLTRLRNMKKALEERGVNAVSSSNLSQIYNEVQNEINKYNTRIKQHEQVQIQLNSYIEAITNAMNTHRYSVAIENLTKAIKLIPNNPDNKEYYRTRGTCYLYGVSKYREAVSDFQTYSHLCEPNSIEQAVAFYLIGTGYEMQNDFVLAASNYSKCIRIDNSFLDAYFRRGIMKSGLNDRTGAIRDYDYIINYTGAAKQAFEDMATVYNNKAYCLIELGNYDTALPLINKALELDANLSYIWDTRGEYYYHKKLYQKCVYDMNKAIELSEHSGNSFYYRGLAKIQLGQKSNGCKDLLRAQELSHDKANEALIKYCK